MWSVGCSHSPQTTPVVSTRAGRVCRGEHDAAAGSTLPAGTPHRAQRRARHRRTRRRCGVVRRRSRAQVARSLAQHLHLGLHRVFAGRPRRRRPHPDPLASDDAATRRDQHVDGGVRRTTPRRAHRDCVAAGAGHGRPVFPVRQALAVSQLRPIAHRNRVRRLQKRATGLPRRVIERYKLPLLHRCRSGCAGSAQLWSVDAPRPHCC